MGLLSAIELFVVADRGTGAVVVVGLDNCRGCCCTARDWTWSADSIAVAVVVAASWIKTNVLVNLSSNKLLHLTTWCQFHQHFTWAFFVQRQIRQHFSNYIWFCDFWRQNFELVKRINHFISGVIVSKRPNGNHGKPWAEL